MTLRSQLASAWLALCPLLTGCDAFLGDWRIAGGATTDAGGAGGGTTGVGGAGGGAGGSIAPPLPSWCRFYGTSDEETIWDVRVAADGTSLVGAGQFAGKLALDPSVSVAGATDGFLARFDLQGEPLDVAPLGASEEGVLNVAVAVAPNRVVGLGSFKGTAGSFTSDASGNLDLVATDFASGPLFAAGTTSADRTTDGDARGDRLVLTGDCPAGLDFGTGPLNSGGYVAFVDLASESVDHAIALGAGSSPGSGHMARFDGEGNVWASAVLGGPGVTDVVCAGRPLVTEAPGQSALLRLGPDGTCLVGRVLPTALLENADLILAEGARPVLSGRFSGTLDVDGLTATATGTETDAFVLFFDEAAQATRLTAYGGLGAEKPNEVVVSPSGFVFVVGEFAGEMVVGTEHASSVEDEDDVYVLKLSPTGEPLWLRAFGGAGRQSATALTFDAQGDLFVGGNAEGSLACASPAPASAGLDDFYLMRFDADTL